MNNINIIKKFEIKRKYLVNDDIFLKFVDEYNPPHDLITQYYLANNDDYEVSVRIRNNEKCDIITKYNSEESLLSRYVIIERADPKDAEIYLSKIKENIVKSIKKVRYSISYKGYKIVVDHFLNEKINDLYLASIESEKETDKFELPSFISNFILSEVTDYPEFYNCNLYNIL